MTSIRDLKPTTNAAFESAEEIVETLQRLRAGLGPGQPGRVRRPGQSFDLPVTGRGQLGDLPGRDVDDPQHVDAVEGPVLVLLVALREQGGEAVLALPRRVRAAPGSPRKPRPTGRR